MKTLTNSEALIMKCLWDCGGEMPMIRLMEKLNEVYDRNWKRTTIRTFLFHLEEKEYLKVYRIGRSSFVKELVSLDLEDPDQLLYLLLTYKLLENAEQRE